MSRLRRFAYRLRSPIVTAFMLAAIQRDGSLPRPTTPPKVHAMGADPDRVLLIGGSAVQGFGVTTHDLALSGQLARRISAFTGRGVDLDMMSRPILSLADAVELVGTADLARYDAVVLMVGEREVSGLETRSIWARELDRLFDVLERGASAELRVFVVEIPVLSQFIELPEAVGRRIDRHAARLNEVTRAAVGLRHGVTAVAFAPRPAEQPGRLARAINYEHWAEALAPDIAFGILELAGHSRRTGIVDEVRRQAALDRLGVVDSAPDERYDRIARIARDALGVTGAAITFLDHDRHWSKAAISLSAEDRPRADTFCATTIEQSGLFVVEDATRDSAFASLPAVTGPDHIRFYAGYPLEAPTGEHVGALCVMDVHPRSFSTADAAILRELALRAQQLLWADADREAAPASIRRNTLAS